MAIKKVDALPPKATAGMRILEDDDLAEMRDNPQQWYMVAEKVTSYQSFNKYGEANGFKVATRGNGEALNRAGKKARAVDVYMAYDPEGKMKS